MDPLRDMNVVNQEILLIDLDFIEQMIIELETIIKIQKLGGEYTHFQYRTLKKVWEFISGMINLRGVPISVWYTIKGSIRPETSEKLLRSKSQFERSKIPTICSGYPIRLGKWDTREREYLSSLHVLFYWV